MGQGCIYLFRNLDLAYNPYTMAYVTHKLQNCDLPYNLHFLILWIIKSFASK